MKRKKNRQYLFMSAWILISIQIASMVSLYCIGIYSIALPKDIFVTVYYHFYLESFIGSVVGAIVFITGAVWFKGGVGRYLSQVFFLSILCLLFTLYVGVFGFMSYEQLNISDLNMMLTLISESVTAKNHLSIALSLSFGLMLFIGGFIAWERVRPQRKALGDAHFANGLEIKKAGFFKKEDESILIGKKYGSPLLSNGFEHVLVFAATGSGKTTSISIPNLFQYPYSVVCNDIKHTLYETTSGFREKVLGQKCYLWSPTSAKTHRFNPLAFISNDKIQRMTDIQRIAHILMPDNKKDPIWSQASRKLFKAVVLYLLDTPGATVTLGEINRIIKQVNFDEWLESVLDSTEHYDPDFYRNGYSYINNHSKTRGSILESFSGYFELFDDPTIDAATSDTDFNVRNLRCEKMTIYIGFSDDDMERLSPLLTLFWQQLISAMIRCVPNLKDEPYPVLCLIDEFSSLGRIERLRRSLKLLREYRIRCILMMQYIGQTYEQYSHDEAKAFTNIKTKIAYTTDDHSDAEFISKLVGTKTQRVNSGSTSYQHRGMSDSKSYAYQAIPLIRPEKIMKLPSHISLIMRTGHSPVKAGQYTWYKEQDMKTLKSEGVFVPTQEVVLHAFDHSHKKNNKNKEKNLHLNDLV